MATYQNRTGNRIELGIGTRPGVPWTRYDSDHGGVVDGPGVANYREVFERAGYTLVTPGDAKAFQVDLELMAQLEAEEKSKAEAAAKAKAEADAKAEAELAKAKAEAEVSLPAPAEKEQARGSNRRTKG